MFLLKALSKILCRWIKISQLFSDISDHILMIITESTRRLHFSVSLSKILYSDTFYFNYCFLMNKSKHFGHVKKSLTQFSIFRNVPGVSIVINKISNISNHPKNFIMFYQINNHNRKFKVRHCITRWFMLIFASIYLFTHLSYFIVLVLAEHFAEHNNKKFLLIFVCKFIYF